MTSLYVPLNCAKDRAVCPAESHPYSSLAMTLAGRPEDWVYPEPIIEAWGSLEQYEIEIRRWEKHYLGSRRPSPHAELVEASDRVRGYSEADLKALLEMHSSMFRARGGSGDPKIPTEAMVLYTAAKMGFASVRRLAAHLGISRSRAFRFMREIARSPLVRTALDQWGYELD